MAQQMFGSFDPELMKQAIAAEEEKSLLAQAKLSPQEVQRYVAASGGRQLGNIVSGIFGTEAQDPRLRQAQMAQEAYQEALNVTGEANSPQFFQAFANAAARRNLPTLAQQAAQQASTLTSEYALARQRLSAAEREKKEASPFSKIDPSKVTKDSLGRFVQTGNITDLEFLPDANKGTEFERLIAGLPPEQQAALKTDYLKKLTGQVMPPALQTLVMQEADAVGSLKNTIGNVDKTLNDLKSGNLKLGLTKNFVNEFKTLSGSSNEASIAYNNFNATLLELQNKALLLNKGTQTEGDAIRALNEFMSNYAKYDTNTAIARLERVAEKFKLAESTKRANIVNLGRRYNEDLTPFLGNPEVSKNTPKYSDDVIRREFDDPKNAAWQSKGFDAFKKKFLEINK